MFTFLFIKFEFLYTFGNWVLKITGDLFFYVILTAQIPDGFVVNQETELGVVVGKTCRNVTEEEAKKAIGGYCLALDMTEVKHLVRCKKINFSIYKIKLKLFDFSLLIELTK